MGLLRKYLGKRWLLDSINPQYPDILQFRRCLGNLIQIRGKKDNISECLLRQIVPQT